MAYSKADIAGAIARANGQPLKTVMVGGLNGSTPTDLGPSRQIQVQGQSPYKKSTGHTYAHVATFSQGATDPKIKASGALSALKKSLWQDRHTAIAAATEMMNSAQAAAGIASFNTAGGPSPTNPVWLQHVPLTGRYFGFEPGKDTLRLVDKGSINFYIAGHSLFIYSCYPNNFVAGANGIAEPDYDLGTLFV